MCYCDVIAAVLKDTWKCDFTITVYFKYFLFSQKGEVPFTSRSTRGQTQTPPTLLTRLSNQYPVGGYWLSYTVQGINSVQQTVKSPPLSHCIQEGGSL